MAKPRTKWTRNAIEALLEARASGLSMMDSCKAADISYGTTSMKLQIARGTWPKAVTEAERAKCAEFHERWEEAGRLGRQANLDRAQRWKEERHKELLDTADEMWGVIVQSATVGFKDVEVTRRRKGEDGSAVIEKVVAAKPDVTTAKWALERILGAVFNRVQKVENVDPLTPEELGMIRAEASQAERHAILNGDTEVADLVLRRIRLKGPR